MSKMKNKKTGIFAFAIFLVILMASSIMAFAVAIPYWDSPEWYPLKLAPGESKIIQLTLQNTGEEDMTVRATLTSGSEIATLIDDNLDYFVASGDVNVPVNIKVEIPADLEVGSANRTISVSFGQIASGERGMVALAAGIATSFPVEIVGYEESLLRQEEAAPQPTKPIPVIWIILIVVLIAGLILFGVRRKKAVKKKK